MLRAVDRIAYNKSLSVHATASCVTILTVMSIWSEFTCLSLYLAVSCGMPLFQLYLLRFLVDDGSICAVIAVYYVQGAAINNFES